MTISQRLHAQVAIVALLVAALAAAVWIMVPAKAVTSLIAVATMAAIWLVVALIGWSRPFANQSSAERGLFTVSVIAAGLMLAAALAKVLAPSLGFDGGTTVDRVLGVGMGAILLVIGNSIPKVLSPLTAKRCAPAQVQSIRRLSGWVFSIAGLVYALLWLFAPIAEAADWAMLAAFSAVVIVALQISPSWTTCVPSAVLRIIQFIGRLLRRGNRTGPT